MTHRDRKPACILVTKQGIKLPFSYVNRFSGVRYMRRASQHHQSLRPGGCLGYPDAGAFVIYDAIRNSVYIEFSAGETNYRRATGRVCRARHQHRFLCAVRFVRSFGLDPIRRPEDRVSDGLTSVAEGGDLETGADEQPAVVRHETNKVTASEVVHLFEWSDGCDDREHQQNLHSGPRVREHSIAPEGCSQDRIHRLISIPDGLHQR